MKKIIIKTSLILSILLTGCNNVNLENNKPSVNENTVEIQAETNQGNTELSQEEKDLARPTIHVSTAVEFINAIQPNTIINVEPGYYNLTAYLQNAWETEEEGWNNSHPYTRIRECFDGVELLIQNVDNLTITGDIERLADTEIVVDPRYAGVINFLNCKNLNISSLTIGHTDTGGCEGNVLNFYGCSDINISHCDLYGCGVYGIGAYNATENMRVYKTTIRDCSCGALALEDTRGTLEFRECEFTGSFGGGYYENIGLSELAFYDCTFGPGETGIWQYYQDIITENCTWSDLDLTDIEIGYEMPELITERLSPVKLGKEILDGTYWIGHTLTNQESGETSYLPLQTESEGFVDVGITFNEDGTGTFEYLYEALDFTWSMENDYSALLTFEDGTSTNITLQSDKNDETGFIWMLTQMYEDVIWLY